jgi:hypothetical protein
MLCLRVHLLATGEEALVNRVSGILQHSPGQQAARALMGRSFIRYKVALCSLIELSLGWMSAANASTAAMVASLAVIGSPRYAGGNESTL